MKVNGKTRYVLVCVELNLRLVSFLMAKTTNAKETAELIFSEIFCCYGGAAEIVSDRSKSFQNELFTNLMQLGNTRHHVTSSYAPWANATEERGVRKLGAAIKAISFGQDPSD